MEGKRDEAKKRFGEYLHKHGVNRLLETLLADLRLYYEPTEPVEQFLLRWFQGGRNSVVPLEYRRPMLSEKEVREHSFHIISDLIEQAIKVQAPDFSDFATQFLSSCQATLQLEDGDTDDEQESLLTARETKEEGKSKTRQEEAKEETKESKTGWEFSHGEKELRAAMGIRNDQWLTGLDLEREDEMLDEIEQLFDSLLQKSTMDKYTFSVIQRSSGSIYSWFDKEWHKVKLIHQGSSHFDVHDESASSANHRESKYTEAQPTRCEEVQLPEDAFGTESTWSKDTVLYLIEKLFAESSRVEVSLLTGGFSGAVVFRCDSWIGQHKEEQTVVKLDAYWKLRKEAERMSTAIPLLGENAPSILGFVHDSEKAAMRIQLCGACWTLPQFMETGSDTIFTFKDLYLQQASARLSPTAASDKMVIDVEELLGNVFGEILGSAYSRTKALESLHLYDAFNLPKLMSRALPHITSLPFGQLADLSPAFSKILSSQDSLKEFFQDFLRVIRQDVEHVVYTSDQHCDLNGMNLLVDSMGVCWIIDFAMWGKAPILRDLAKLESCVMFEYTHLESNEQLTDAINASMQLCNESMFKCASGMRGKFSHMLSTVARLRHFADIYTRDPDGNVRGPPCQHAYALLARCLDILRFDDVNLYGKLWALGCAILHCKVILREWKSRTGEALSPVPLSCRDYKRNRASIVEQGIRYPLIEKRYLNLLRMQHGFYTDAVTCQRFRVDPGFVHTCDLELPEELLCEDQQVSDSTSFFKFHCSNALPSRLIIFGPAGSGKTVLCSKLICDVIEHTTFVPVYLSVMDLIQQVDLPSPFRVSLASSKDLLDQYWVTKYGETSSRTACLRRARSQGRVILFCDGLTHAGDQTKQILQLLLKISSPATNSQDSADHIPILEGDGENEIGADLKQQKRVPVKLVVTSRSIDETLASKLVKDKKMIVCRLQELGSPQIRAIIEARVPKGQSRNELLEFCQSPQHQQFAKNPLLLSLLITSFSTRTKASGFVNKLELLENWIKFMMAPLRLSSSRTLFLCVRQVLSRIAFACKCLQRPGLDYFTIETVLNALTSQLEFIAPTAFRFSQREQSNKQQEVMRTGDLARTLNLLFTSIKKDESPLFRCLNRADALHARRYTFCQPTVEQYLAASYIAEHINGAAGSLESVYRRLLDSTENVVSLESISRIKILLKRLSSKLVSDGFKKRMQALATHVEAFCQEVVGGRGHSCCVDMSEIASLIDDLAHSLKNASNKRDVLELGSLLSTFDQESHKHFSLVRVEHGTFAFLLELLPHKMLQHLFLEIMPCDARQELFCTLAGSNEGSFLTALETLLRLGVDANVVSPLNGWSALMLAAACSGHAEKVRVLLGGGADVSFTTLLEKRSALYESCRTGNFEAVKLLVDHGGADVNMAKSKGFTPFLAACSNGHVQIAQFLAERGANIHVKSASGATSLYLAVKSGNLEMLKLLQDLFHAEEKSKDTVMSHKVILTVFGGKKDEFTLLASAIRFGKYTVTEYLLQQGADPNETFRLSGVLVSPAWLAARQNGVKSLTLLAKAGAKLNFADPEMGLTPLLVGALYGRSKVIEFLLSMDGVNLKARSCRGETALELAMKKPYLNATNALVEFSRRNPRQCADLLSSDAKQSFLNLSLCKCPEKVVPALEILCTVFEPTPSDLEAALRNFTSSQHDAALDFLVHRVPNLCEKHLVRAMLPVAVRSRNINLFKALLHSNGLDEAAIQQAIQISEDMATRKNKKQHQHHHSRVLVVHHQHPTGHRSTLQVTEVSETFSDDYILSTLQSMLATLGAKRAESNSSEDLNYEEKKDDGFEEKLTG